MQKLAARATLHGLLKLTFVPEFFKTGTKNWKLQARKLGNYKEGKLFLQNGDPSRKRKLGINTIVQIPY